MEERKITIAQDNLQLIHRDSHTHIDTSIFFKQVSPSLQLIYKHCPHTKTNNKKTTLPSCIHEPYPCPLGQLSTAGYNPNPPPES